MTEQCPNGCGELDFAYGRINDLSGNSYFKVIITYCPKCGYIDGADANW